MDFEELGRCSPFVSARHARSPRRFSRAPQSPHTRRWPISPCAGLPTIVVTAQHLNEERSRIDTQTGAPTYTFNSNDIQSAPGGDKRAG